MYLKEEGRLWIGQAQNENKDKVCIIPKMANRHGLIAGATGTGKTITLKVLAESFSDCGVPVFAADIKGDIASMCQPGVNTEDMQKRITKFGLEGFNYTPYPTCIWDVLGEGGHPLRTTISNMGPILLGTLLELNDTQSDILSIVFRIADDNRMLLIDIKDLRLMLEYVSRNLADFIPVYGNMTKQSIGAISRSLLSLEEQGGNMFFGEPAIDIADWIRTDAYGRGYINILHAVKLIHSPKLYATFMLWMLTELFENLPEEGDMEKPKMVFFFDEAHLLFNTVPKSLMTKIEQVVKLIRSKGIGVYFITQSPSDVPNEVLSQLGNRVQHALRAYTPSDQKAVRAAAQSFRANTGFSTEQKITELGTGEALISFLDEEGRPSIVEYCKVLPPQSRMGSITDEERFSCLMTDGMGQKYDTGFDRESAYEQLSKQFDEEAAEQQRLEEEKQKEKEQKEREKEEEKARREAERIRREEERIKREKEREEERQRREKEREEERLRKEKEREEKERAKRLAPVTKIAGTAMTTIGREVGKQIVRGLFGNRKR
ncbi:MAG: DUF853 family protein [Blautia sp.]|nr:DUF853 family protein [Blautia sp.]